MSEVYREQLDTYARNFRAERADWPSLWHSFVQVRNGSASADQVDTFWLTSMGDTREAAAIELASAVDVPSVSHAHTGLVCRHYFAGDGFGAFALLARLMMQAVAKKLEWVTYDRSFAPYHWLELVHATCRGYKAEQVVKIWNDERGLLMSMLIIDTFSASAYAAEITTKGLFPMPALLGKAEQRIMDALRGVALTADDLAHRAEIDRSTMIRRYVGDKGSLRKSGLVKNNRKVGYYRPDDPPPMKGGKSKKI